MTAKATHDPSHRCHRPELPPALHQPQRSELQQRQTTFCLSEVSPSAIQVEACVATCINTLLTDVQESPVAAVLLVQVQVMA